MASKALLPAFGGSYLVWGACMVFFQGMLLAGYLYAHLMQSRIGAARYSRWHWLLLLAGFTAFPFSFGRLDRIVPGAHPALDVVFELALLMGPPFLAVSTMGLVLQRWLSISRLPERENAYALYSPSNLGSMLGLLSYPTVIEPLLNLKQQAILWWTGFGILFFVHFLCLPGRKGGDAPPEAAPVDAPPRQEMLRWFLLSAAGTAMLLAVTNVLTLDIASVPFLWVLPLGAYLLTFVLVFKRRMWFPDWIGKGFNWSVIVAVLLFCMAGMRLDIPAPAALAVHLLILFCVCINCHGMLVNRKPRDPAHMTLFYTILSLGGFCGSLFVSWIVPPLSSSPVEYLLALMLALAALGLCGPAPRKGELKALAIGAAILATSLIAGPAVAANRFQAGTQWIMAVALLPVILVVRFFKDRPLHLVALLGLVLVASAGMETRMFGTANVLRLRNFYGIYKVYDHEGIRYLKHGTTLHGREHLDREKGGIPLSYHHPTAPAGELLRSGLIDPGRAGMIGLGTGAMAMYFRKGSELTIYELDPDNVPIANEHFRYLRLAKANGVELRFVIGDGRLSLRKEPDRRFDLLLIDAFSSGAIPVHLLTKEAVSEYLRVLKPDGLLLLHVSNRIVDLKPVVYAVARSLGMQAAAKSNEGAVDPDADMSEWMVVCKNREVARVLEERMGWSGFPADGGSPAEVWTDRRSNLFSRMFRKRSS